MFIAHFKRGVISFGMNTVYKSHILVNGTIFICYK